MKIEEKVINCTSDEEKKELLKTELEQLLKELKLKVEFIYAEENTIISKSELNSLNEEIYKNIGSVVKSLSSDKDKLDILLVLAKSFCKIHKKQRIYEIIGDIDDYAFDKLIENSLLWKKQLDKRKNSFINMKNTILKSLSSSENSDILNEIEEQLKQLDSLVILKEDMKRGSIEDDLLSLYELVYNILNGLDGKYKEYNPEIVKAMYLRKNEITLEGVETYGEGRWIKCNAQNGGIEKENYEKYDKDVFKKLDWVLSSTKDNYMFIDNNQIPRILVNMSSNCYTRRYRNRIY